jgi:hypothetical protein
MNLRRASLIAACVIPFAAGAALVADTANAQFTPAPQQQQQEPPCVQQFTKLRDDTQKKALAIREASQHKVPAKEACKLFNVFSAAEAKMLKYAEDNQVWCGIPKQIVESIKQGHTKSTAIRVRVCAAAEAPARSAAPSLSDALGSPTPNSNNIKTGHGTGTFDTLTGPALGSK